jgi:hypothetical protein
MAALPRARASVVAESALTTAAGLYREEEVRFSTRRSLLALPVRVVPVCL